MEEYQPIHQTGMIHCCECSTPIPSNPSNMCVDCLRLAVDITADIPKNSTLASCRNCERFLSPPSTYVKAALESRELLGICLKKMKPALMKVRLVDASFIWTEPHSKRIKVKFTVQKQVLGGTCLEQVFVTEFIIHNEMCTECHRVEAKDFWKSNVQVRQKVLCKRTFYYLEQVIKKYNMHMHTNKISQQPNGLDFFYAKDQEARHFTDFLTKVFPIRCEKSKRLISHDTHCGTYNYKISYSVELPGVNKNDIVCLPKKTAQKLGNLGQLLIVQRVTNHIHLIDSQTLQIASVGGGDYWRHQFFPICDRKSLIHFTVMRLEKASVKKGRSGTGAVSKKHALVDCYVIRSCELGMHDNFLFCRTHLGHVLRIGDSVLGLDMENCNPNNVEFDSMKEDSLPDVILVKKIYDGQKRKRKRKFKLQRLDKGKGAIDKGVDGSKADDGEFNNFLEDLEEDEEMRKNVDMFRVENADIASTIGGDNDYPRVSMDELLDEVKAMTLQDVEMEE